ncbi:hypothetical protein C8A03DRAFT_18823 [Achaetomium macrosporum]|uniref:Uncharacterized protein n=1 Tax=Achaetomium macrosporum TaxID=79813 RepID=A0AAN7C3T2_9PEZI|nr:hypothetical protein C8A03DRAFT_18823 [Achaetomium macrosporum]
MCLYPIVKFACCDIQFHADEHLPIVKFCPRGHPDTIRERFRGCPVRQPHECNDLFRLPIKCPGHKLQWLTQMDLNDECQEMDRELFEAGVSEHLRFRYREKMGRAFEMVAKCAQLMEAERLQAWKVKIFCTGATLELLGNAIVGSDAKSLDYSVLEKLRERLVRHINAEAQQLKEDAIRRGGRSSLEQVELGPEGELVQGESQSTQTQTWMSSLNPPQSPSIPVERGRGPALDAEPPIGTTINPIPAPNPPLLDNMQRLSRELLPGRPSPRFLAMAFSPAQDPFHQDPAPIFPFPVLPPAANRFPPPFVPSQNVGPGLGLGEVNNDNLPHLISQFPLSPERQFQVRQGLLLNTQMQVNQSTVGDGQFNQGLGLSLDHVPGGGITCSMHDMASFGMVEDHASEELTRASVGEAAFGGGEQCLTQAPVQMDE